VIVVDASAVLAVLGSETGAEEIVARSDGGLISTVNLAEVVQKAALNGVPPQSVGAFIDQANWGVVPFDDQMAIAAAELWTMYPTRGLSLGDRACLALAQAVSGIALTLDTGWSGIDLEGAAIHLVRR